MILQCLKNTACESIYPEVIIESYFVFQKDVRAWSPNNSNPKKKNSNFNNKRSAVLLFKKNHKDKIRL